MAAVTSSARCTSRCRPDDRGWAFSCPSPAMFRSSGSYEMALVAQSPLQGRQANLVFPPPMTFPTTGLFWTLAKRFSMPTTSSAPRSPVGMSARRIRDGAPRGGSANPLGACDGGSGHRRQNL
jgi:hypothetical protein